jgi:hypothetical protein
VGMVVLGCGNAWDSSSERGAFGGAPSRGAYTITVHMIMHMTLFRSLPADPAWGAWCVACVRSLLMRDRARAMRPARYVGSVGKGRF